MANPYFLSYITLGLTPLCCQKGAELGKNPDDGLYLNVLLIVGIFC